MILRDVTKIVPKIRFHRDIEQTIVTVSTETYPVVEDDLGFAVGDQVVYVLWVEQDVVLYSVARL